MDQSNSAKIATTKAPQQGDMEASAITGSAISPLERHLGLIKAIAIIMAVLIIAALATIIVTIYGRLTLVDAAKNIQEYELIIPVDSRVGGGRRPSVGGRKMLHNRILPGPVYRRIAKVDPFAGF